jgi:hypothetical protein
VGTRGPAYKDVGLVTKDSKVFIDPRHRPAGIFVISLDQAAHTHTHTHTHKHKHTHKRTRTSTSTSIGPSKTSHTLSTADEFTNLRAAEEGSSPLEGHWNLHNGHNGTVDFALTARAEENRQTPMVPSGRRLSQNTC